MMPTVKVKSSHPDHVQGFYIINESDFDEAKHELWVDEAAEAKKAAAAKAAQVNAAKPVLHIAGVGNKPDAGPMSSGDGKPAAHRS